MLTSGRVTLSLPDTPLGPLRRRDGEPVFDEQWQAQVLGIADLMVASGVISADSWASALGSELRRSAAAASADNAETYYRAVLAALQALIYESGATAHKEVEACEDAWRRAYLNTPHGMPVELGASTLAGDEATHRSD